MYSCDEMFICSRKCYYAAYFTACFTTLEKNNTKTILFWMHEQFATWVILHYSVGIQIGGISVNLYLTNLYKL